MSLSITMDLFDSVIVGDIKITYIRKTGRKVSLSFTAPKDIKITRIKREEKQGPEIVRKKPSRDID